VKNSSFLPRDLSAVKRGEKNESRPSREKRNGPKGGKKRENPTLQDSESRKKGAKGKSTRKKTMCFWGGADNRLSKGKRVCLCKVQTPRLGGGGGGSRRLRKGGNQKPKKGINPTMSPTMRPAVNGSHRGKGKTVQEVGGKSYLCNRVCDSRRGENI